MLLTPNFGTRIRGFLDFVKSFKPSIVYCNDELDGSVYQAVQAKRELGVRIALFHWELLKHMKRLSIKVLNEFDLHICGCSGALKLLEHMGIKNVYEKPVPQVGINVNLFKPLGGIRTRDLIYAGGRTVNKGIHFTEKTARELGLSILWVGKQRPFDILPYEGFPSYGDDVGFIEYEQLPLYFNRAKVLVMPEIDTPAWVPQFGFVIGEALSCGLRCVISDAGDNIENWGEAPGVRIVPQGFIPELKEAILSSLKDWEPNLAGRRYIIERYSCEVIANELIKAFERT